jgi:N-methylhydantoinase B
MQSAIENTRDPLAKGDGGGTDGAPSVIVVRPGAANEAIVNERASFFGPFEAGDLVSVRSGGGGGWGPPLGRDPEQVARDVRDELLSREEARAVYGVALVESAGGWVVDRAETGRLRQTASGGGDGT